MASEILTGELAKGTVTLAGFQSTTAATVARDSASGPKLSQQCHDPCWIQSAEFPFTFQNQCLLTR